MGIETTAAGLLGRLIQPMHRQWLVRWGRPLRLTVSPRYEAAWTVATPQVLTSEHLTTVPNWNPNQIHEWLVREHAALPYLISEIDILMESRGGIRVLVSSMTAEVESRSREGLGAIIQSPPAGAIDVTFLGFDLSKSSTVTPVIVKREIGDEWTPTPFFSLKAIDVGKEEAVPLKVLAKTGEDTVAWRLRVSFRAGGRTRELVFPPDSEEPFRVTGVPSAASEQHFLCGVAGLDGPPYLRETDSNFNFDF